jgi:hypothetical protein
VPAPEAVGQPAGLDMARPVVWDRPPTVVRKAVRLRGPDRARMAGPDVVQTVYHNAGQADWIKIDLLVDLAVWAAASQP